MGRDDFEDNEKSSIDDFTTQNPKNDKMFQKSERKNQPAVHLKNQNHHTSFVKIYILMMNIRTIRHMKTIWDLFGRRDYVSNVFHVTTIPKRSQKTVKCWYCKGEYTSALSREEDNLNVELQNLWKLEALGIMDKPELFDCNYAIDQFSQTICFNENIDRF